MLSSSGKAGYNRKISEFIINSLHDQEEAKSIVLDVDENVANKYAIALQSAWRRRQAKIMVSNLKQESNCKKYRANHPVGDENGQFMITNCDVCLNGQQDAERREKLAHQRYTEIDRLLFEGQKRLVVNDRGDNWNQRFQSIISLPENTDLERSIKYAELYTLNHDFVNTATTYAQTIISEFFLHQKDKSIRAKKMGGIAGGEKYLWRGILFKMATGASGPYNGSDEAAAKAAGHDLKGSIHYYNSGVKELHVPLMAVIDYKGFRMTAQALLPLGKDSLVYGSADAGRTVLNSNEKFNLAMEQASRSLNLRKHVVGELTQIKELHSAVDVEGHVGLDNRFYLLDLARTFPPEAPTVTRHLQDVFEDGTIVLIKTPDPENPSNVIFTKGSVHRAYSHGSFYDILFDDGSIGYKIPSTKIQSRSLSIFWRLLRPEYVRTRGTRLTPLKQEDINPINSAAALKTPRAQTKANNENVSPLHAPIENNKVESVKPITDNIPSPHASESKTTQPNYDSFENNNPSKMTAEDTPDYDNFDAEKSYADPPIPPIPKLGVMRQQTLGYDDFDTIQESDNFDSPLLSPTLAGYDSFDPTSDVTSPSANPTTTTVTSTTSTEGQKYADDYGFFRNTLNDDSLPPSANPKLSSTPSTLRMKANQDFETKQIEEIINLLDHYRNYDIHDLETEKGALHHETLSRKEELMIRQAYIDATVNDLYQSSDVSDSQPSGKSSILMSSISSTNSPLSTPLSPDALTSFSRFDPEAVDRNREVIRATERLIQEVVPAMARQLASMRYDDLSKLDLSVYFHSNGVNIRHMGLVRSHIPASPQNVGVRTFLLLNIVCRTLKNIARDFQRRWMKSEQSSSEQGILILLTQFLNLIVGQHINSEKFWSERVIVGIFQRFGKCALDGNDAHLQTIRKSPTFLTKMLNTFLQMMNMKLKPAVIAQFMKDEDPYKFEFMVEDIESLEPKVKYMHIIDFVSGVMLQEQAALRAAAGDDHRTITRLRELAGERFANAERTMPLHNETCKRSEVIRLLNAEQAEKEVQPSTKCKYF